MLDYRHRVERLQSHKTDVMLNFSIDSPCFLFAPLPWFYTPCLLSKCRHQYSLLFILISHGIKKIQSTNGELKEQFQFIENYIFYIKKCRCRWLMASSLFSTYHWRLLEKKAILRFQYLVVQRRRRNYLYSIATRENWRKPQNLYTPVYRCVHVCM